MMNESTSKILTQLEAVINEIDNAQRNRELHVVCKYPSGAVAHCDILDDHWCHENFPRKFICVERGKPSVLKFFQILPKIHLVL